VLPAQALHVSSCNRVIRQRARTWCHFGFRLNLADEVIGLHNDMARAGVAIVRPLYRDETLVSFRCADPDGYAIEVYWEAPGAALD